jgi:hypothetical protein
MSTGSASMDFHGLTLARVLEDVAHALAEEEPIVPVRRGLTLPAAPLSAPKMISTLKK